KVTQFSKHLMCEDTGISYEEPSPNTFSFNSPYGACPRCKGLGMIYEINMDEVIPDYGKSIKEGGIAPLGEAREAFVYKQVEQLGRKYMFSLNTPLSELPQKTINLLLFGDENGKLEMDMGFDVVPANYNT